MPAQTLAFFGATGDCAGFTLAAALKSGFDCVALVRNPAKLTKSLKAKDVPETALDQHLTMIQGDVREAGAVEKALVLNGRLVDTIITGIGAPPSTIKFQFSLTKPLTTTERTICREFAAILFDALANLVPSTDHKPLLIALSTTGIPAPGMPRDLPWLAHIFYQLLLQDPHEDKSAMETIIREQAAKPADGRLIDAYVTTKFPWLLDGPGKGVENIKAGTELKPIKGYTIHRADVGDWVFENLVKEGVKDAGWRNHSVTIA